MTNEERDIQRKLRVLQHAEKIGNARKACRYFGIAEYRSSMDSISEFLQEECAISSEHSCTATQLYAAYRGWCLFIGKRAKTKTAFKRAIVGIQDVYQKRLSSGLYWMGIKPFFVGCDLRP